VKHLAIAQQAVTGLGIEIVLTDPTSLGKDPGQPRWIGDLDGMFAADRAGSAPSKRRRPRAALLYTSGTTADPKGVELTQANLLGEVNAVFGVLQIGPKEPCWNSSHVPCAGADGESSATACQRRSRGLPRNPEHHRTPSRLQQRQITVFAVVPQFFYLIHERIFKEVGKPRQACRVHLRTLMRIHRFLRKFGLNAGKIFFGKIHATFGARMRYLITGGSASIRWLLATSTPSASTC